MEHANGVFVKALYYTQRSIKDANEVKLLQIDRFMVSAISQNGNFLYRCNNSRHTFMPFPRSKIKPFSHIYFYAVCSELRKWLHGFLVLGKFFENIM